MFREINEKYAEIENHNKRNVNSVLEQILPFSNNQGYFTNVPVNGNFCDRLSQQICVNIGSKALDNCRLRLREKIRYINDIICGKFEDMPQNKKDNIFPKNSSEGTHDVDFNYVPREEWVYETPPRQKTIVPKVKECNMQPAVLYTNNNRKSLYEMNPNITIDLTRFSDGQNVPYDKRFMQHVATVDRSSKNVDDGIRFLEQKEQNNFDLFGQFQLSQFQATQSSNKFFNFGNYFSENPN